MTPSRECCVYVMVRDDGWCKIGVSENPKRRKQSLGSDVRIWRTFMFGEISYKVEITAHRIMELRGHERRFLDWFRASPSSCVRGVMAAKKEVAADSGVEVRNRARAARKNSKKATCACCSVPLAHKSYLDETGDKYVCVECWKKHMGF